MHKIKLILLLSCMMLACHAVKAQTASCNLSLYGHLHTDNASAVPPDVVSVYMPQIKEGVFANGEGNFTLKNICPGRYEIIIKYLGYQTIDTFIQISHTMHINFLLVGRKNQLADVTINGKMVHKNQISTAVTDTLSGQALEQTRGLSLGESLKNIPGLNSIQTGPSVSKPVIHGVYGDRILIMNNGVRQEGQQWGNDHAPEVDPFIATKIAVIKGAASLRYGSDALGGVILLDPKDLRKTPGIDGEANLVGMSNGHIGVVSGMIEGTLDSASKGMSWRLQGTTKRAGNEQAAHYYMKNTGLYENDFSGTLQYTRANWGIEGYYSQFYTKIGIATASAVGSLQDLYTAFEAPVPVEKAGFTYGIERPYQKVNHKLFKSKGVLQLHKMGKIELQYSWQKDIREEYDRDVSYNDSIRALNLPDLYFQLITNTADLIWDEPVIKKKITGSMGFSFITQGNLLEHTAYQELIPNFRNYGEGAFIIEKLPLDKLILEGGLRYDHQWLRTYMLNPTTLIETNPTYHWGNTTISGGAEYDFNKKISATYNFGTAWRPPDVIELFADGIHQSAASFDIGDSSLTLEQAYESSFALQYHGKKLAGEINLYYNYYHHYIYAKPDSMPVETIQGAFPAFTYTQVNALFRGGDISITYHFLPHFALISKASIIRAYNLAIHNWLVDIPADRYDNTIRFELPSIGRLRDCFINVNNLIIRKQFRVPPHSDYVQPPPGYMLWGGEIGCTVPVGHHEMDISLSGTNLANVSYRDYLNRFRYYLDDLGRNISLRIRISFGTPVKNN